MRLVPIVTPLRLEADALAVIRRACAELPTGMKLEESGLPRVHGARTLRHAPDLYVVGVSVELAGLLREIGREARDVARAFVRTGVAGRR